MWNFVGRLLEFLFCPWSHWTDLISGPDWPASDAEPRIGHLSKELQRHIRKCGRRYLQYQPLFWVGVLIAIFWTLVVIRGFMESPWMGLLTLLGFLLIYWLCYIPAHWRAIDRYLYDHSESGRMKHCLNCDYDMRGSEGDKCPECGTSVRIVHMRYATRRWKMRD